MQPRSVRRRALSLPAADGDWPDNDAIAALSARGVEEIAIAGSVQIGGQTARQTLQFIRFLRDCESFALRVIWHGRFDAAPPSALLSHLQPPASARSRGPHGGFEEESSYSFGRLYWRAGPGFITICDTRPARPWQRIALTEAPGVHLFTRLQAPTPIADCADSEAEREALLELLEEGIVLCLGDQALSLPCRMRFWPVPYMAI